MCLLGILSPRATIFAARPAFSSQASCTDATPSNWWRIWRPMPIKSVIDLMTKSDQFGDHLCDQFSSIWWPILINLVTNLVTNSDQFGDENNKLMTNMYILMNKLMNKSKQIDWPQRIWSSGFNKSIRGLTAAMAWYTLRQWGATWCYIRRFVRDAYEKPASAVRCDMGLSRETSKTWHATPHLRRECDAAVRRAALLLWPTRMSVYYIVYIISLSIYIYI